MDLRVESKIGSYLQTATTPRSPGEWKLEVDIEVKRQIPCPGYEFKRSASYLQHQGTYNSKEFLYVVG